MHTYVDNISEHKKQSSDNTGTEKQKGSGSTFQLLDKSPKAILPQKMQKIANNSAQVGKSKQFQSMANDYTLKTVQRKINDHKVQKTGTWIDLQKTELGASLIKDISKEKNTAYIDHAATGPFYAEPVNQVSHGRVVGDVNVQIPTNDKLEAKRKKTAYREEGGAVQDKNRATVIAYHELGHALHLLRNEAPGVGEMIYHEVRRNDAREFIEHIPLEEALNVGFRDNPTINLEHRFYEQRGVAGVNERPGDNITEEINRRTGTRLHKENDFRQSQNKGIRIGYNLPPQ